MHIYAARVCHKSLFYDEMILTITVDVGILVSKKIVVQIYCIQFQKNSLTHKTFTLQFIDMRSKLYDFKILIKRIFLKMLI